MTRSDLKRRGATGPRARSVWFSARQCCGIVSTPTPFNLKRQIRHSNSSGEDSSFYRRNMVPQLQDGTAQNWEHPKKFPAPDFVPEHQIRVGAYKRHWRTQSLEQTALACEAQGGLCDTPLCWLPFGLSQNRHLRQ